MNRDDICAIGVTFVEDEKYTLSRYCITEQDLFFKAWNETFANSPLINDEQFKKTHGKMYYQIRANYSLR